MNITSGPFKIKDHEKDCFRITINGSLTASIAQELRDEVTSCIGSEYEIVYIDAQDVDEADLSGVNEVIHSHYQLDKSSKKLIFLYRQGSGVEKWVDTTGLDKFVATALVPAI